jgi:hypothetical protein
MGDISTKFYKYTWGVINISDLKFSIGIIPV